MIKMNNVGLTSLEGKQILDHVNLDIKKHEFVAIIGPNGAGKSSLLKLIAQDIKPTAGRIEYNYTKQDIGIIFQDPSQGTWENLTVEENIQLSLHKKRELKPNINMHLKKLQLDLENKKNLPVRSLSGGQRQSLNLLMATISQPSILLLDEHTSALDPKTALFIMDMTAELSKEQEITTVMITHNLKFAAEYASRILVIKDGKICHDLQHKTTQQELYNLF